MIATSHVEHRLSTAFPGANITIEDLTGTSDHFRVTVIAKEFAGKSRIERHQLVYAALEQEMKGAIHALALTTKTPEEP